MPSSTLSQKLTAMAKPRLNSRTDITARTQELLKHSVELIEAETRHQEYKRLPRPHVLYKSIKMDRFDVIKFDDLTGPGGDEWIKIGGGSFGVVFRVRVVSCISQAETSVWCLSIWSQLQGEYLGTEVAIKEVLPNNTYDVEKYFERECVLMKWV